MATPIQYLDKAMTRLRDLGLVPEKTEEAPIVALLNRVSDLDNDKVVAIARTLSQASLFNQVVREQVASMSLGEHRAIVDDFCDFMAGQTTAFVRRIEKQMYAASEAMDYEKAARLRDDLGALEKALEKQAVVLGDATISSAFVVRASKTPRADTIAALSASRPRVVQSVRPLRTSTAKNCPRFRCENPKSVPPSTMGELMYIETSSLLQARSTCHVLPRSTGRTACVPRASPE